MSRLALLTALGWALSATGAIARDADAAPVIFIGAGAAESAETPQWDSGHVSIGRALDIEGRMVFAVRPPPSTKALGTISGPFSGGSPLAASRLTSSFGLRTHPLLGGERLHSGIDLAAPSGTPIRAASDGIVGRAGWAGGYGLLVELDHAAGVETRYGHMSNLAVSAGQRVSRGDVIGWVGSTGRSTGPHLHYELRVNGRAIDPRSATAR